MALNLQKVEEEVGAVGLLELVEGHWDIGWGGLTRAGAQVCLLNTEPHTAYL